MFANVNSFPTKGPELLLTAQLRQIYRSGTGDAFPHASLLNCTYPPTHADFPYIQKNACCGKTTAEFPTLIAVLDSPVERGNIIKITGAT